MMGNHFLLILITAILIGFVPAIFIYLKAGGTFQVSTEKIREIIIDASRFKYDPSIITVKRGERIKLIINNIDTLHGVRIPDLGISGNESLEFVADKLGEFNWYCNNYCGDSHSQMQGKLIIE